MNPADGSLDELQSFKFGYLSRCVEAGMTPTEIREKTAALLGSVKQALLDTVVGKTMDTGRSLLNAGLSWTIPLAVVGPPAAGYLAGRSLAKINDAGDRKDDVAELHADETVGQYDAETERLRRIEAARRKRRQLQAERRYRPL